MSRVLLLCPEPLGHQRPAGVGIRFLEFARALTADGHSVVVLSPDAGAVEGCRAEAITPQSIRTASSASDVAIVQGHVSNDFFAHAVEIPTVIDFYDPFIIENFNYRNTHGDEVFEHDYATVMRCVSRGDLFLCASDAQRIFYLGLFLAARRLDARRYETDSSLDSLIRIVPFGVQPLRPQVVKDLAAPRLLFGGIYDWYEPKLAIEAVAIARREIPELSLSFTRHPNPEITPQGAAADAVNLVKSRGYGEFVSFEPWVAYEDRGAFYERFAGALITFPRSLETDLAMRTRIFDYLWAGLPVITSPAPGTDDILKRFHAGSVVESQQPATFAREIVSLLSDRARYDREVQGARAYAQSHQWPRLVAPLLEFCRSPRIDRTKFDATETRVEPGTKGRRLLQRLRRTIGGPRS